MSSPEKVRPSAETTAIADYFLANPSLNIAIQQGGLDIGPIGEHILSQYFAFKRRIERAKEELPENKKLRLDKLFNPVELDRYSWFAYFAETKLPMLAAEYGPNITDKLIEGFFASTKTQTIYASGLKTNIGDLGLSGLEGEKKDEEPKK